MSELTSVTLKAHELCHAAVVANQRIEAKEKLQDARQASLDEQSQALNDRERDLQARESACLVTERQLEALKTLDANTQKLDAERIIHGDNERTFKAYEVKARQEIKDLQEAAAREWEEVKKAKAAIGAEIKKQVDQVLAKVAR